MSLLLFDGKEPTMVTDDPRNSPDFKRNSDIVKNQDPSHNPEDDLNLVAFDSLDLILLLVPYSLGSLLLDLFFPAQFRSLNKLLLYVFGAFLIFGGPLLRRQYFPKSVTSRPLAHRLRLTGVISLLFLFFGSVCVVLGSIAWSGAAHQERPLAREFVPSQPLMLFDPTTCETIVDPGTGEQGQIVQKALDRFQKSHKELKEGDRIGTKLDCSQPKESYTQAQWQVQQQKDKIEFDNQQKEIVHDQIEGINAGVRDTYRVLGVGLALLFLGMMLDYYRRTNDRP